MAEKSWILMGVLAGSVLFNVRSLTQPDCACEAPPASAEVSPAQVPSAAEMDQMVAAALQEAPTASNAPEKVLSGEWSVIRTTVSHSLTRTFSKVGIEHADALSMVFARLFVWDISMNRDLMKGDKVEVVYKIGEDGFPDIAGARFYSKKHKKTYSAFKWQAPGDQFASYWAYDGTEAAYRLKHSPVKHYEQITSLLKDGRGHKGMDFKAPVGTPTTTPKSGRVTRVNFGSFKYNGNCAEVEYSDGTLAKWLHLETVIVKAGQTVKPGTKIGTIGNTGRSTAAHLHYQLDKGKRNLDPVKYHGTLRRQLPERSITPFLQSIGPVIDRLENGPGIAGL